MAHLYEEWTTSLKKCNSTRPHQCPQNPCVRTNCHKVLLLKYLIEQTTNNQIYINFVNFVNMWTNISQCLSESSHWARAKVINDLYYNPWNSVQYTELAFFFELGNHKLNCKWKQSHIKQKWNKKNNWTAFRSIGLIINQTIVAFCRDSLHIIIIIIYHAW